MSKSIIHAIAKANGKLCAASGEKDNTIIAKDASEIGDTASDLEDSASLSSDLKAIELMATLTDCVNIMAEIIDIDTVPNEACKEILSSFNG